MKFTEMSCTRFVDELSGKNPVPGGGGASALTGAVGVALGNMVGALTIGKKKYASVEADIYDLVSRCDLLRQQLLALVERDAQVFEPLAAAYRMPSGTDDERAQKERVMEAALKDACDVPVRIMEKCAEAIDVLAELAEKGSVMALSDAGCGVLFCKAALQAASLNVFINTRSMKDREAAEEWNRKAQTLLDTAVPTADEVYARVADRLQ